MLKGPDLNEDSGSCSNAQEVAHWDYLPTELKVHIFSFPPLSGKRELSEANKLWLEAGWMDLIADPSDKARKRLYNLLSHYEECLPATQRALNEMWAKQGRFSSKPNLSTKLRLLLTLHDFEAHKKLNESDAKFVYLAACNKKYAPYAWPVILSVLKHYHVDPKIAIEPLEMALIDIDEDMRESALRTLNQVVPILDAKKAEDLLYIETLFTWLARPLKDGKGGVLLHNNKILRELANRLDAVQAEDLLERLMARLKHMDWWIRDAAALVLAQLLNRFDYEQVLDIIAQLTEALKHPDWWVREGAARGLVEVASHLEAEYEIDLVTPLETALNMGEDFYKTVTASLGKFQYRIGTELAIALILLKRLKVTDIANLTTEFTKELKHIDWPHRAFAIQYLGIMARRSEDIKQIENIIPLLTKALSDPNQNVCEAAIHALDQLINRLNTQQAENLIAPLIEVSENFNKKLSEPVAQLLGKLVRHLFDPTKISDSSSALIKPLIISLRSGDEKLAKTVIKALRTSMLYLDVNQAKYLLEMLIELNASGESAQFAIRTGVYDQYIHIQRDIASLISELKSHLQVTGQLTEKVNLTEEVCSEEEKEAQVREKKKIYKTFWGSLLKDEDRDHTIQLNFISSNWQDPDMQAGFDMKKLPKPIIPVPEAFMDMFDINLINEMRSLALS